MNLTKFQALVNQALSEGLRAQAMVISQADLLGPCLSSEERKRTINMMILKFAYAESLLKSAALALAEGRRMLAPVNRNDH